MTGMVLRDDNGRRRSNGWLRHRIVVLRRKLRNAELQREARARFIATLSHEFREPMNGVLGMAAQLRETALTENQREYLAAITESAEALLTVVNDVLDLSRIDAGRIVLRSVAFDPADLLRRLMLPLAQRARERKIALVCDLPDVPLPTLLGDPGRLRQVLLNLIGNAMKFTNEGSVSVAMATQSRDDGMAVLTVEIVDTGIGIVAGALPGLFQPFSRAGSDDWSIEGSGLGLVVCRHLVEAMGGTLELSSEPDVGTTVRLLVPMRAAVPPSARAGEGTAIAGMRLLLVTAKRAEGGALRRELATLAVTVTAAADAHEAQTRLEEVDPGGFDAILIDASVPRGATALARQLRGSLPATSTAFVLLAPAGLRGDAAMAAESGFAAYLPMTVDRETLRQCLSLLRAGADRPSQLITRHSLAASRRLRVLVVDDNAINCRLSSLLLERAGHEVHSVADGRLAVEAVAAGSFDLVLMDVEMPVMNGRAAARAIRSLADVDRRRVPIVAVTARAMPGDDEACRAAGMDDYVGKPIDRDRLLAAVARATAPERTNAADRGNPAEGVSRPAASP